MISYTSSHSLPLTSTLSGILAHLLFWIHGEWDSLTGQIFLFGFLIHCTILLVLHFHVGLDLVNSYVTAIYLETCHLAGTFASVVLYRLFFHRLRYFPGPLGAKIWIWDIFVRTWASGHRQSIVLNGLHSKYGPVVRYAPDRLSINYAAAVPLVHGTGSASLCTKSVVYLNPVNGGSINADREVASHHARRKLWERALSARVLPSYIPPLVQHTFALLSALRTTSAEPVNVNNYVRLFTFDAMGTVGFGRDKGFDGLSTGTLHPAVATLIDMMGVGVYMMLVPWLHVLADYVPAMGIIYRPDELFRGFAKETLGQYCDIGNSTRGKRKEDDSVLRGDQLARKDSRSFTDILNQIHPSSSPDDRRTLSDCVLLAIAGADTTSSSLVHILYRLARHKDIQDRAYQEILRERVPESSPSTSQETQFASWVETAKLPYLEALIREALRLHPPAPTGLPRLSPAEGFTIQHNDGTATFISGHTNVSVPVYTLLRDPQNFSRPLDFVPERFLPSSHPDSQAHLVLNSRAYIPFLQGPYGCAGKQFAYMEMKIVMAGLLSHFNIAFPEATNVEEVNKKMDLQWRDFSTVKAAPIDLRFVPRTGGRDVKGLRGMAKHAAFNSNNVERFPCMPS